MEAEDRLTVWRAVFSISQHPPVLQLDLLIGCFFYFHSFANTCMNVAAAATSPTVSTSWSLLSQPCPRLGRRLPHPAEFKNGDFGHIAVLRRSQARMSAITGRRVPGSKLKVGSKVDMLPAVHYTNRCSYRSWVVRLEAPLRDTTERDPRSALVGEIQGQGIRAPHR